MAVRPSPLRHYRLVDYLTQGYLVLVALLILIFHNGTVPAWRTFVAIHLALIVVAHLLIVSHARRPDNRILSFCRHFYPMAFYAFFYGATSRLNRMFFPDFLDAHFIRLEAALFGFQPSILFMEKLPHLVVSELFYAAYFSYYVMIFGVGLSLYLRDRERFLHYLTVLSFVFYICYFAFIIFPVGGPCAFWMQRHGVENLVHPLYRPGPIPEAVRGGPFFHIMGFLYRYVEAHGAAFPSSHVAVAIVTLTFTWRYLKRVRLPHLAAVLMLMLATVYCRYHYAVDVLGGVAAAALLAPIAEYLYRKDRTHDALRPASPTESR